MVTPRAQSAARGVFTSSSIQKESLPVAPTERDNDHAHESGCINEIRNAWMQLLQLMVGEVVRQLDREKSIGRTQAPTRTANKTRIDQGRGVSAPPIHMLFLSCQKPATGRRCLLALAVVEVRNSPGSRLIMGSRNSNCSRTRTSLIP